MEATDFKNLIVKKVPQLFSRSPRFVFEISSKPKTSIEGTYVGLGLFRNLTYWQETFQHGHFGTWTVCLQRRFGKETIWHMNFLAQKLFVTGTFHTWIFRHGDLSAEGHFGSGTIR